MQAAIERCAKSEDYQEGRRAFMEKRKPVFTGK
jgi:enoyl-CoA hydratase/carnithine racemase